MKKFTLSPQAYYNYIVHPTLSDLSSEGGYNGTLADFSVMDNVSSRSRIIDLFGTQNILKRRDDSCNIIFSPVGKATAREIETTAVYGATKHCENEFYQGCFEDFRNSTPRFTEFIFSFFKKALKSDIIANAYFGDITRPNDKTGMYNWNTFDGIFKQYAKALKEGHLKPDQAITIGKEEMTPTKAYDILSQMYSKQSVYMNSIAPKNKSFIVSSDIFFNYEEYLRQVGGAFNIEMYTNGVPKLSFRGIPVKVEQTWSPILNNLSEGSALNIAILTVNGNHVFATDKNYGEYTDKGVKSLLVWYDNNELSWKYVSFLKVGTGIADPSMSVIAMPDLNKTK